MGARSTTGVAARAATVEEIFTGGLKDMTRAAATVKAAVSVAELTALNRVMGGTGSVEAFERELVTRVFVGARAWLDELGGHELTRDQRRRWNAAVRRVNRFVPRGGVTMTCTVLASLDQSRDLLDDPHLLKTALVAAAAHGPATAVPRVAAPAQQQPATQGTGAQRSREQLAPSGV